MTNKIHYLIGDATHPVDTGADIHVIAHCCNDIGAWGAGFVLALNKLNRKPKEKYRAWAKGELNAPMKLGMVQLVKIRTGLIVANMIGQHGIYPENGIPPVRYEAVETALDKLCGRMNDRWPGCSFDLHMPRIGCGLAKGEWSRMEQVLRRIADKRGVHIYVYDLTQRSKENADTIGYRK